MERLIFTLLLSAIIGLSGCADSSNNKAIDSDQTSLVLKGDGTVPEWTKNLSLYEVNVRQYSEAGTFKAVEEDLDRLKAMGVGILWLMPIHPIGELNRKGEVGSYYSVKDYKGIDPSYGDEADFRSLINKAHEKGMYLIIDWVANHSAWDNPLTISNPNWYTKDSVTGDFTPPVADWADVIDFNFDQGGLRNYLVDALKYWVSEFDIDGYRCDVAGFVPTSFWDSARAELDILKPVFMLAEWEDPALHTNAFDMTYGWEMHHVMNGIAKGEKKGNTILELLAMDSTRFKPEDYRLLFTSNHDENTWNGTVFERMGSASEVMAVLSYALPGMPLIYSGQEAPLKTRLPFFEKEAIDWNNYELAPFYSKLNTIRKSEASLWSGKYGGTMDIIESNDTSILIFKRENEDSNVLMICNLSNENAKFILPEQLQNSSFSNLMNNEKINLQEEINLAPWAYYFLSK
jgi:cyclomaltodextrinase